MASVFSREPERRCMAPESRGFPGRADPALSADGGRTWGLGVERIRSLLSGAPFTAPRSVDRNLEIKQNNRAEK
jgi:hypothetical protein